MTRKDYIAIAEALRYARGHAMAAGTATNSMLLRTKAELAGVMASAEYIANAMHDDNPRFDREHFLAVVRGEKELQSRPARKHPNNDCGSCGGHIGPSSEYPWHYQDEDCRAIREPRPEGR